jgi:thiopeptide-type bacteriocin biosynthesis protein
LNSAYINGEYLIHNNEKNQPFASEFLFCFKKAVFPPIPPALTVRKNEANEIERRIVPGNQWVFLKIYCGYKIADQILSTIIYPFCEKLLSEGEIDKFFFIRYSDPDNHIRLRLFKTSYPSNDRILKDLNSLLFNFLKENLVYKVQIDTYQREIERYSPEIMLETETLFCVNSKSVLQLLSNNSLKIGYEDRWRIGIKVIDLILDSFGLTREEKKTFVKLRRESFFNKLFLNANQKKAFSNKYHSLKKIVELDMDKDSMEPKLALAINYFETNLLDKKEEISRILQYSIKSTNSASLITWLSSYIHMFANRLFITDQNAHEMVIYDFLTRYYEGVIARDLYNPKPNS